MSSLIARDSVRVWFSLWAPGWPWHRTTRTYPASKDWKRSYAQALAAYLPHCLNEPWERKPIFLATEIERRSPC